MTSPSVSDDAAMTSASQDGWVAADTTLQPARRRNTDQRDRFARDEPVELAAGNGQRLVDRVDTGQIDNLAADDHENIRRDDAVTVVDRGIFPQPADVGEAGTRGRRAHHAVAALHADDAVEIDRPNRAAALGEYPPRPLLHLALEHAHPRRGGGKRHALETNPHRLGGYFTRLDLADLVAALAGAHLGCTHRGGANAVGMLIDLDRYLNILGRGPKRDHGLECLAADSLQVLGRWIGNHALDHVAHQRERDADRGNHLRVL